MANDLRDEEMSEEEMYEKGERKKLSKGRKKEISFVCAILLGLLLIVGISQARVFKVEREKSYGIVTEALVREITWWEMLELQNDEPTNINKCWDKPVLPNFVKEDLKFCEKRGIDLEYHFKDTIIRMIYADYNQEWQVYFWNEDLLDSPYFENFSMFKNNSSEIVFYGYGELNCFFKITVKENSYRREIFTRDTNIPLEKRFLSISAGKVGEYSLLEEDDVFYFYKDGELINTCEFTLGNLEYVDIHYGLAITTEKDLYMIYADTENDLPVLNFYYIDKVDSVEEDWLYCREERINLPIIIKDNKYCLVIPEDWETYKLFGIGNTTFSSHYNQLNSGVNIVEAKEFFKEATFDYDASYFYNKWKSTLTFDINGFNFEYTYDVNGYDSDIDFPVEVAEKFEKTVTSTDEFWNNIESLRVAYFDYYDHEGE